MADPAGTGFLLYEPDEKPPLGALMEAALWGGGAPYLLFDNFAPKPDAALAPSVDPRTAKQPRKTPSPRP